MDILLLYLILVLIYGVLKYRKHSFLKFIFLLLVLLIIKDTFHYFKDSRQKKIQVFSAGRLPVVELIDGHQGYVITQSSEEAYFKRVNYHIENYHIRNNLHYRFIPADSLHHYIPSWITGDDTWILWNGMSILISKKPDDPENTIPSVYSADILIECSGEKLEVHIPGLLTSEPEAGELTILRRIFGKRSSPCIRKEKELTSIRFQNKAKW